MSSFVLIIASFFHYIHGQTVDNTSHCIQELPAITSQPIQLNLSDPSQIAPNYSVASSIAYHHNSSTILIAGDYFYIDPKDASKRTYYQYFKALTHTKDNQFNIKYEQYAPFTNAIFGYKFISHQALRSWTRIIAHPSLPYFYLLGINNLTAYHVTNGQFLWTATIPPCSTNPNPDRPVIYNDATFFKTDSDNIYVGGSCIDQSGKTVIVLDEYSIKNGKYNDQFRQLYNLTDLGFFKSVSFLDGFGIIPPEVTMVAPVNKTLVTSIEDRYFYVGFTHVIFSGIARIEYDVIDKDWRVKKWPEHWTLVNPSFVMHHNIVPTMDGLIALSDPALQGVLDLVVGQAKHFKRWKTIKKAGQIDEKSRNHTFTWYGGHDKHDLHLDWTLSIDPISDYQDVYVTTAPLQLPTVRTSTVAKHNAESGLVIGGAKVPFFAVDSVVTNDGQLITVGFQWTPSLETDFDIHGFSPSDILPFLQRKAVFQVFNHTSTDPESCVGCEVNWYGGNAEQCRKQCPCHNGYCNDDLNGDGSCYCTFFSHGETCELCTCDPLKGLCDSGPTGSGHCKFCYDVKGSLNPFNLSFGLGDHYGPKCETNCTCHPDNGICYTTGNDSDPRAGQCIYCTNNNAFGDNCDQICDCDAHSEYCSNGISGTGCIKYDYGGLLNNIGWEVYTIIGTGLFGFFFIVTFWHSNKRYKEQHNGQSIPCCPVRKKKGHHEDMMNGGGGHEDDVWNNQQQQNGGQNDLRERMINAEYQQYGNGNGNGHRLNLQSDDPNEPPAVSHVIDNGNRVIEQNHNDEINGPQRYDM